MSAIIVADDFPLMRDGMACSLQRDYQLTNIRGKTDLRRCSEARPMVRRARGRLRSQ